MIVAGVAKAWLSSHLSGVLWGAAGAVMLGAAAALGAAQFTIGSLRKEVARLTAENETKKSDIDALRAAQDVQNQSIQRLVAAVHARDAATDLAVSRRIANAKAPLAPARSAEELNQWLESVASQR